MQLFNLKFKKGSHHIKISVNHKIIHFIEVICEAIHEFSREKKIMVKNDNYCEIIN